MKERERERERERAREREREKESARIRENEDKKRLIMPWRSPVIDACNLKCTLPKNMVLL